MERNINKRLTICSKLRQNMKGVVKIAFPEQLQSPKTNWGSGAVLGEFLRMVVVFFHQDFMITCATVVPCDVF